MDSEARRGGIPPVPPPNGYQPVTEADGLIGWFDSAEALRKWRCSVPPGEYAIGQDENGVRVIAGRDGTDAGVLYYTAEGRWVLACMGELAGIVLYRTLRGSDAHATDIPLALKLWHAWELPLIEVAQMFARQDPIPVPLGTVEQEATLCAELKPGYPAARDEFRRKRESQPPPPVAGSPVPSPPPTDGAPEVSLAPPESAGRRSSGDLKPGGKALSAAYELRKEGRPVSLNAACKRAGVDRKNIRANYPEVVNAIRAMAAPDRTPARGMIDRRTGRVEAVGDDDY